MDINIVLIIIIVFVSIIALVNIVAVLAVLISIIPITIMIVMVTYNLYNSCARRSIMCWLIKQLMWHLRLYNISQDFKKNSLVQNNIGLLLLLSGYVAWKTLWDYIMQMYYINSIILILLWWIKLLKISNT